MQIMLGDARGDLSFHYPADGDSASWRCADFVLSGWAEKCTVRIRMALLTLLCMHVCVLGDQGVKGSAQLRTHGLMSTRAPSNTARACSSIVGGGWLWCQHFW